MSRSPLIRWKRAEDWPVFLRGDERTNRHLASMHGVPSGRALLSHLLDRPSSGFS